MTRRRWVTLAIVIAGLIALLPLGRWERQRWLRTQNSGIQALLQSIQGRFSHPYAYRHGETFACLLYSTSVEPFGKELCINPSGYVIEAIDRIPGRDPEIWTVRPEPGAATTHVNPSLVAHLLNSLGAQNASVIETGLPDVGPQ